VPILILVLVALLIQPAGGAPILHIADGGSTYHRPDCPSIKGLSKIVAYRRQDLPKGAEPCSICRPDEAIEELPPPAAPVVTAPPTARVWTEGVKLLTPATYKEAITCGAESPWWRYCAEENLLQFCSSEGVSVSLVTPFVNVMTDARSDANQLRTPAPRSMAAANKSLATIEILPGSNMLRARTPTRLILEKNGERLNPTTSDVTPVVLTNAFGVKRTAARATYTFPLSAFSPESSTILLFAFETGQPDRCELSPTQLRKMR
jgi:hypothetical protein